MDKLIDRTRYSAFVTPLGKGCISESINHYRGTYMGKIGKDVEADWVNSCDLVVRFGPLDADTNTYGFTTLTRRKIAMDINDTSINLRGIFYNNLDIKALLLEMNRKLDHLEKVLSVEPYPDLRRLREDRDKLLLPVASAWIDQKTFWLPVSDFLKTGDIILTESGTSSSGGQDLILPPETKLINSAVWISIGYTLAVSVGVALAQRDMAADKVRLQGRTILLEGDGGFQRSAQAISDVFRNRLDLTIFLLNNNGYTTERHIHGMTAEYNYIHPWNYLASPHFFRALKDNPSYLIFTRSVENRGQLLEVLEDKQLKEGNGFSMVEVVMGQQDALESLKGMIRLVCEKK